MSTRNRNFEVVQINPARNSMTGVLAVAAVMGMLVSRKAGAVDTLELADGTAGLFLRRDVVDAATLKTLTDADILRPNKADFVMPYTVNGAVTAEDYAEVWVEGTELLDSSMDANTLVDSAVTTKDGKIAELTDSEAQEALGIVRQNVAAINHAAPARRFLIEVRRAPKNVPAAGA